jgi:hypothetical protein
VKSSAQFDTTKPQVTIPYGKTAGHYAREVNFFNKVIIKLKTSLALKFLIWFIFAAAIPAFLVSIITYFQATSALKVAAFDTIRFSSHLKKRNSKNFYYTTKN